MYIFLSQLFTPLLSPLGISTALWLAAFWFLVQRRTRWAGSCAAAGILLLLLFSTPIVAGRLLGSLEDDFAPLEPEAHPEADAIVVLGGVTSSPAAPRVSVHVEEGFDRLLHGMRLLRAGKAPVILLSGGRIGGSAMSEAEQMKRLALEYGVPGETVLLDTSSRTTRENAVACAELLRGIEAGRILLVTSASHMRRAAAAFTRQGLSVVPAPTDIAVVPKKWSLLRLVPDARWLRYSTRAVKEYVGYTAYWLWRWV